jgi:hypothetical protein
LLISTRYLRLVSVCEYAISMTGCAITALRFAETTRFLDFPRKSSQSETHQDRFGRVGRAHPAILAYPFSAL